MTSRREAIKSLAGVAAVAAGVSAIPVLEVTPEPGRFYVFLMPQMPTEQLVEVADRLRAFFVGDLEWARGHVLLMPQQCDIVSIDGNAGRKLTPIFDGAENS